MLSKVDMLATVGVLSLMITVTTCIIIPVPEACETLLNDTAFLDIASSEPYSTVLPKILSIKVEVDATVIEQSMETYTECLSVVFQRHIMCYHCSESIGFNKKACDKVLKKTEPTCNTLGHGEGQQICMAVAQIYLTTVLALSDELWGVGPPSDWCSFEDNSVKIKACIEQKGI